MTPREILELEVSFLLVRHGKQSVLKAIAHRIGLSDQELEADLRKLTEAAIALKTKKSKQVKPFNLDPLLSGRAEKADSLKQLQARFENKIFLPEVKDIKRFFDRHGKQVPSIKSRLSAQAAVFKLLADLDLATLTKLLADSSADNTFSSLGIISDEILGRRNRGERA